jgi:two-component system chemotaxis response regulator CheB
LTERLIVMGSSAGGLHALGVILGGLHRGFPAPIAIAQHRSADVEGRLVELLSRTSRLPVQEAEDKHPLLPGHVYLAPPDYHMLVERGEIDLSVDAPVSWARPSIDVLFESAAYAYGPGAIAVALTGGSDDGAAGAVHVKAAGGMVLVQDPAGAYNPVLPRAVLERIAAHVLPLDAIAGRLAEICGMSAEVMS